MRYWYLPDVAEQGTDIRLWPATPAPEPEYRVIVPARELTAAEWKRLPDSSALAAVMTAGGAVHRGTTYAMAEEISTATLVESVALRFVTAGNMAGVALWWDWRWHGAIVPALAGGGLLTRERLELLITTGSAEVPLHTCGRCLREGLKQNKDGSLRAHKRLNWHPPYREECK